MTTGKTIALTRWTFVGQVISLLFNMLSRLVITFLPRSKCLLISWLQSPSTVSLEPRKIVSHCFHCFPIYLPCSDGTGCHDSSFLNVACFRVGLKSVQIWNQYAECGSSWSLSVKSCGGCPNSCYFYCIFRICLIGSTRSWSSSRVLNYVSSSLHHVVS